jgi:hypothetical protein
MKSCIEHLGAKTDGYGVKKVNGKLVRAHRFAFCQATGRSLESIEGLVVMHVCDNRICVNPAHLKLGTHADNQQDKVDKNRQAKGEKCGKAKLFSTQVKSIKRLLPDFTNIELGKAFGVHQMTISKIRTGKTWVHIK